VKEAKSGLGVNRIRAPISPKTGLPEPVQSSNDSIEDRHARLRPISGSSALMKRVVLFVGIALAISVFASVRADHTCVIDRCRACGGSVQAAQVIVGYTAAGQPIFQWHFLPHHCRLANSYERSYRFGVDHYRRDRINGDHYQRDRVNTDAVRVGLPGRVTVPGRAVPGRAVARRP
jgi:hypothetical protein